jgi:hypothetical protein
MKNAIQYKEHWLMKSSDAYELFQEWKVQKDDKLAKVARKKFEDHFKSVLTNYEKSIQD